LIKKIRELNNIKSDIWFLKTVNNKIIINNNYSGISIYNENFHLIKIIFIIDNLTIYSSYINNNEILLYCDENMKLVYINVNNYEYKIINLTKDMTEITFSKAYVWHENTVILSSYDNDFFEVNLNKSEIKRIDKNKIREDYYDFYNLYKIYKACLCEEHLIEIFNEKKIIVVYNNKKNNLNIIKYNNGKYKSNKINLKIDINFYNIIYEKDIIAVVDENVIEIITKESRNKLIIKNKYMYCKVNFYKKNKEIYLIVVISDKSFIENSKLILYKIENDEYI